MRPNVVHDLNHKYAEYHMYQFIMLHSCDYLQKISIKINVATDKGNRRVELWHWTNDDIGYMYIYI